VFARLLSAALVTACAALSLPAFAATPQLQDQNGRSFALDRLNGEPVVVTFIATHCKDACPLINGQFANIARTIEQQHIPMRLLTVTLDPEHDSARDMQRLAREFSADPRTWIFASGKTTDVHAIMRKFGVIAERGASGYADQHTTFVYIVDRHGKPRKVLLASTVLTSELLAEVQREWRDLTQ